MVSIQANSHALRFEGSAGQLIGSVLLDRFAAYRGQRAARPRESQATT
jgi:hypothetical protein